MLIFNEDVVLLYSYHCYFTWLTSKGQIWGILLKFLTMKYRKGYEVEKPRLSTFLGYS